MSRALRVVRPAAPIIDNPAPTIPVGAHPLVAACAGTPVALEPQDVDLIAFVNAGHRVLDVRQDPDRVTAATMVLAWYADHVGTRHRTDGERAVSLASHLGRYLVPFLHELNVDKPADQWGIDQLWFAEAEGLVTVLAGAAPLPAATVAGDLLHRVATSCLWLTVPDAGHVSHGGIHAVRRALADGTMPRFRGAGRELMVRPVDLRRAGLLIEPDAPHGLSRDHANNVLYPLKSAMVRAANLGAHLRGNFDQLSAVRPLARHRMRPARVDPGYVGLDQVRAVAGHLSVVHQIVLWLVRLTGMRLGEAFGLLVGDLTQAPDGAWQVPVNKQGGAPALVRNDDTGTLEASDTKPRPKTDQSRRLIRLPDALGELLVEVIEVFHTDPDGTVRTQARLIPGLRNADISGAQGFRTALAKALATAGVEGFHPHDMRGFLITDLKNAGVDERLRRYFVGHDDGQDVHDRYDDGVPVTLQTPATDAIGALVDRLGLGTLIVATSVREGWGTATDHWSRREEIWARMRQLGWLTEDADENGQALLTTAEVAARLGCSQTTVKRKFVRGELPARQVRRQGRLTWMLPEQDLAAHLEGGDTTVGLLDLAGAIGMDYHQTLALCGRLQVLPTDRPKGHPIRLDQAAVQAVHAELARRRHAAAAVVDLDTAAQQLGLPLGQVEKLYRNRTLEPAPSPTGTRRRYVTNASVQRFEALRSNVRADPADRVVPIVDARILLGVNRIQLSTLISTGQIAATSVRRRQCVTLASAIAYATRVGRQCSVEALQSASIVSHS